MAEQSPVPQVGSGNDLRQDIVDWVSSAPLRELVRMFGGDAEIFVADELVEVLRQLDVFSDRWDTRRGQERNLAASLDLDTAAEAAVLAAAAALGLTDIQPPRHENYDHVLMLGGLLRACVTRPAYAAKLIRSRQIATHDVTALGGHRPFGGDEHDLAIIAGFAGVSEEFAALDAGTRRAFGLGPPCDIQGELSDLPGGAWSLNTYRAAEDLTVRVAAAPSSEPETRRANTADSYDWFATDVVSLRGGERLLIITTAIYVPAQHTAALRMLGLPYNVEIETVGMLPGQVVPELTQTFSTTHYLQEIRSTIRCMLDLVVYLDSR